MSLVHEGEVRGPAGAPCTAAPSPMAIQFTNGRTVINPSASNFAFATTFGGCQLQGFTEPAQGVFRPNGPEAGPVGRTH